MTETPNTTWQPDPLLTIDQVAHWLGKPKNTLYAWHSRGKGPRAIRVGNTPALPAQRSRTLARRPHRPGA